MSSSLIMQANLGNMGINSPYSLKNKSSSGKWKKNPLFSTDWKQIYEIIGKTTKYQILSCELHANDQIISFNKSKIYVASEFIEEHDTNIFPDFPDPIQNFQSMTIKYQEILTKQIIESYIDKSKISTQVRDKNNNLINSIEILDSIDQVSIRVTLFQSKGSNYTFETIITENAIKMNLKEKPILLNLIYQPPDILTFTISTGNFERTIEFYDITILISFFLKNLDPINFYEFNKTDLTRHNNSKLANFLKTTKIQNLVDYFTELSKFSKQLQNFLEKNSFTNYFIRIHFYFDDESSFSTLSTNFHLYLPVSEAESTNLELKWDSKTSHPEEFQNDFTAAFWSQ